MEKRRSYRWFVHPLDAHTNEVLFGAELEYIGDLECSDGQKRKVWQAKSYSQVAYIRRSHNSAYIKFEVYVQEGNHALRKWTLPTRKKKKISTKKK